MGAPWRSLEDTWKVPGRSLEVPEDPEMLCFPRNLKGSVPGVPDANLVQLFKSLLWRVPGGSLEVPEGPWGPWRSLENPWRVPGGSLEVPEGPWGSLEVPGGSLEGPWRAP